MASRPPTRKQVLRQHIIERHDGVNGRWGGRLPKGSGRWTLAQLARWHCSEHRSYGSTLDHYHAGENGGPGQQPPGWDTGEDTIMREDRT